MLGSCRARWLLALGALLGSSAASSAQAATPAECIASSERAQTKRDEGQLLASRTEFVACAADACPAIVKRECLRWLAEVDERIPSLVVSVKEPSGKDALGAEVSVDGVTLPEAAKGRAVQLDPGPHVVRARLPGRQPIEERFIARERERERVLSLVAAPLGSQSGAVEPSAAGQVAAGGRVPTLSWVLGGVAVAGGGAFAYFWASGMSRVGDLRGSCAPYCTASQIDEARAPLTIARVALGVSITAAVGAITLYLLRPAGASARASAPLTLRF